MSINIDQLFDNCESIEDAKKIYRDFLFKFHPDHGGNDEDTIKLIKVFEDFLVSFMDGRINQFKDKLQKENRKYPEDLNGFKFAKILKQIINFNITIEIIGHWIYCFDCYDVKDKLKELGFWYTKKHKAWVFSGTNKLYIKSKNSLNENRQNWGSQSIKDNEKQRQIGVA